MMGKPTEKKKAWRVRVLGEADDGTLRYWEPFTEPTVTWLENGRAAIQWKKMSETTGDPMGVSTIYVAANHSFSIVPIEIEDEPT